MARKKQHSIADFRPQERNANKHTERGVKMLGESISKDGWIGAITVAADGETFDGSARLETVSEKFGEDVEPIVVEINGDRPVIVKRMDIPTAGDERARRLAIAANRIAEVDLSWDADILAELSEEIDLSGLFDDDEITDLLFDIETEAKEEDEEEVSDLVDQAENGAIESRVSPGQVWQLGRHFIACADSTVEANIRGLMKIAGVEAIDMVWADPPYGISVVSKDGSLGVTPKGKYSPIIGDENKSIAYESFRVYQKFSCYQCWWGANHYASAISDSSCWIVWDKQDGKSVTFADCELAWTNIEQPARIFTHVWDGFRRDSERGEMRVHPTQKPVALFSWFFEKYGKLSDRIIDPFLGSGGSVVAAQQMEGDRRVIGFELSPEYCEVICQRFEKLTGVNAKLAGNL